MIKIFDVVVVTSDLEAAFMLLITISPWQNKKPSHTTRWCLCVFLWNKKYMRGTHFYMPRGTSHEVEMNKVPSTSNPDRTKAHLNSPLLSHLVKARSQCVKKADDQTCPVYIAS